MEKTENRGFVSVNVLYFQQNQANEIICQPFVSKEAIEKFLEDTIRKKAAQVGSTFHSY